MSAEDDVKAWASRAFVAITGLAVEKGGTFVEIVSQLPIVKRWEDEAITWTTHELVGWWEALKAEGLHLIQTHPELKEIWDAIKPPPPQTFECPDDFLQAFIAITKDHDKTLKQRVEWGLRALPVPA